MRSRRAVLAVAGWLAVSGSAHAACVPSWQPVPGVHAGGITLEAVSASSPTDVWAVGRNLAEHWDGAHWFRARMPTVENARLRDVAAADDDQAWAVGNAGAVGLIDRWDGRRWRRVPLRDAHGLDLEAVGASGPSDAWAVGRRGANAVVLHWDGRSWRSSPLPRLHGALVDVVAPAPNDVWAIGRAMHNVAVHWDGRRWSKTILQLPPGNPDVRVYGLAQTANGVVAVGVIAPTVEMDTLTGDGWGVVYRSGGGTWTRIVLERDGSYASYEAAQASPYGTWIASNDTDPFSPQGGTRLFTLERPAAQTMLPVGNVVDALAWDGRFLWAVGWVGTGQANPNDYTFARFRPLIMRYGC